MVVDTRLSERLSEAYGERVTIWGPYLCADGRMRVDVRTKDKPRGTTHQYAKVVLEAHLGRKLTSRETVDHVDEDKTNDSVGNLQVLSLADNAAKSSKRLKAISFNCPHCGSSFELSGKKLSYAISNRKRGKSGPFCGRKCSGLYGAQVQNKVIKPLTVSLLEVSYTT